MWKKDEQCRERNPNRKSLAVELIFEQFFNPASGETLAIAKVISTAAIGQHQNTFNPPIIFPLNFPLAGSPKSETPLQQFPRPSGSARCQIPNLPLSTKSNPNPIADPRMRMRRTTAISRPASSANGQYIPQDGKLGCKRSARDHLYLRGSARVCGGGGGGGLNSSRKKKEKGEERGKRPATANGDPGSFYSPATSTLVGGTEKRAG